MVASVENFFLFQKTVFNKKKYSLETTQKMEI